MRRGLSPRALSLTLGWVTLLAVGCAATQSQGSTTASPEVGDPPTATQPQGPEGQEDNRPGVAVWPFANGGSFGPEPWDYSALEVGLQQMLITELAQNSELRLINRSHLQQIIEELDLGQTGYVSPETTAAVGNLVQARYMVVGSFVDAAGTIRLDARIDNVETGEILVETAAKVQDDRDKLLSLVVDLGVKIVESVSLPALPNQVVEERKAVDFPGEEAGMLYSQAILQDTLGNRDEAVRILRSVVTEFPEYDGAREMLEQYGGGSS